MDTLAASVSEANHDSIDTTSSSPGGISNGNAETRVGSSGKRIGRKSSLSFRRIPGFDPDTGEVICPKRTKSAAVATMFVHRARKATAKKSKGQKFLLKNKLKKKLLFPKYTKTPVRKNFIKYL